MSSKSDYLETEILKRVLQNDSAACPASLGYVALFTTATTDAGGGTEVTGGGYARVLVTWSVVGDTATNSAAADFGTASGNWGTVTHVAIYSAVSGGNLLYHGPLSASKTVNSGDGALFPIGTLSVQEL